MAAIKIITILPWTRKEGHPSGFFGYPLATVTASLMSDSLVWRVYSPSEIFFLPLFGRVPIFIFAHSFLLEKIVEGALCPCGPEVTLASFVQVLCHHHAWCPDHDLTTLTVRGMWLWPTCPENVTIYLIKYQVRIFCLKKKLLVSSLDLWRVWTNIFLAMINARAPASLAAKEAQCTGAADVRWAVTLH